MKRTCLSDDKIKAMLFEDENESGESDESYIPSNDDGEVNMTFSDPESDYDSSSDAEDVGGLPFDASTLKSRNV